MRVVSNRKTNVPKLAKRVIIDVENTVGSICVKIPTSEATMPTQAQITVLLWYIAFG